MKLQLFLVIMNDNHLNSVQLAGALEYADCISAEG